MRGDIIFQSTLPTRGSDSRSLSILNLYNNFNPRSPRGGATIRHIACCRSPLNFNPRSPRGGATATNVVTEPEQKFQSTLPTRGSDEIYSHLSAQKEISIHAPHEGERRYPPKFARGRPHYFNPRSPRGGATNREAVTTANTSISIHAPHEGERHLLVDGGKIAKKFQSTLPTRGSDAKEAGFADELIDFNPRSPRGGATYRGTHFWTEAEISIHAPHEGERPIFTHTSVSLSIFQSTLPTRGSDQNGRNDAVKVYQFQSTLPTRGSDKAGCKGRPRVSQFQSTLPTRGSDLSSKPLPLIRLKFQSTLPTRGSDNL